MSRKNYIVGNWKMNVPNAQAGAILDEMEPIAAGLKQTELWIAPAFGALPSIRRNTAIRYGSQNVHWSESGAFTGEISAPMVRELGGSFAIVGHSERRHIFGESNELVARRALGAMKLGLDIILCCGEKLEEREAKRTVRVLDDQLEEVLEALKRESCAERLVIAYEPVWAIGTGKVASEAEIEEAHASIQEMWRKTVGGECCPILYGGSVTPENFAGIIKLDAVAGALVGGASLKPSSLRALLEISEAA